MKHIGKCTECGAENCALTFLDGETAVCDSCLEMNFDCCDDCGEYYDTGYVEFFCLKNGRKVCEYCREDYEDDELEEMD